MRTTCTSHRKILWNALLKRGIIYIPTEIEPNENAIKKLKNRKALGLDGISNHLLGYGKKNVIQNTDCITDNII